MPAATSTTTMIAARMAFDGRWNGPPGTGSSPSGSIVSNGCTGVRNSLG